MKKNLTLALALALAVSAPAAFAQAAAKAAAPAAAPGTRAAAKETLAIDAAASKVAWTGRKITNKHEGGFKTFGGTIDLVEGNSEASGVTVEIDVTSLFTDSDRLAGHLKSPDFFDAANFPKATFTSAKIRPATADPSKATHIVTGTLEIRGQKKPVSFPATITVDKTSVTATASFKINRKDYGMAYTGKADDLIADDVDVTFNVVAPRKKA